MIPENRFFNFSKHQFALTASIISVLIGLLVLIGWQTDITILKTCGLGAVTMKPNAAALFVLSGLSLLLLQFDQPISKWLSRILSLLIILVGFLTLAEFIFILNFGIDELLYSVTDTTGFLPYPSRIAANAALNFVLLGLVLFFLSLPRKGKLLLIIFSLVTVFSISIIGLLSFVFGFSNSAGATAYSLMAINAAVLFIVLCFGIYFTIRKSITEITIAQKLLAGLTLSATIIILLTLLIIDQNDSMHKASSLVEHSEHVKDGIQIALDEAMAVETGALEFVIRGNDAYPKSLEKTKNEISGALKNLRDLTSDNPIQQNTLNTLEPLFEKQIEFAEQLYKARKLKGLSETISILNSGRNKSIMDSIRATATQMIKEENRLSTVHKMAHHSRTRRVETIVKIGFLFQALILSIIFIIIKNDISGRRRAEESLKRLNEELEERVKKRTSALRKNEARLIKAQQIAHLGFLDWNLNTNEFYCSDEVYRLYGIDLSEKPLSLEKILEGVHPDDADYVQKKLELAAKGEEEYNIDHRIKQPNGDVLWVHAQIELIYDVEGKPKTLLGTVLDITERKLSEAALEERTVLLINTLELNDSILESAGEGIYGLDLEGNSTFVNQAAADILGYSKEELLGIQMHENHHHHRTDGSEYPRNECPINFAVHDGLIHTVTDEVFWRKNGTQFPVEYTSTPIYKNGKLNGAVVVFGDITERKLAEEKIAGERKKAQQYFEIAGVMLVILDNTGKVFEINRRGCEILGYSANEIIGKDWFTSFLPENIAEDVRKIYEELMKGKSEAIEYYENPIVNRKGEERLIDWHNVILKDSNGNPVGTLSSGEDITERKRAEEKILNINAELETKVGIRTKQLAAVNLNLEKAKAEAEKANVAKSEFLSRMSHELRTPMNSILGFAQLLNMQKIDPIHKKGVDHIIKSGKHLLELINEVLDLSRIEAGKLSLSIESIELNNLISETLNSVQPLAEKKNIELLYLKSTTDKLFIKADRQKLKQVLINLISNAIKFNREAGSVKVDCVEGSKQDKRGKAIKNIKINVMDTGIGITAKDIQKLFNPFQRLRSDITEIEGTGLGLAVAKKLTEAMHGTIGVESKPNAGSTFWIELPNADSVIKTKKSIGSIISTNPIKDFGEGTLLYIEDNYSNIELVEDIIDTHRPDIRLITNMYGKNALTLVKDYQPDLILLDLDLPDIKGDEVLKLFKTNKESASIPVVILSADAMPDQIEKLLKAGANRYLTKPIDVMEFLKVVDENMNMNTDVEKEKT